MNAPIGKDLALAARLLAAGEVVAIPTETVYGLAGNALDPAAVVRIYEAKARPRFNPLIVHTGTLAAAQQLGGPFPAAAIKLAEAFWPGPLTLLLPRGPRIPELVTAGSPLVALRIPSHPLTLELLQQLAFPLAAPSANPFGYISPTRPEHVAAQLGERIAYILDGGASQVGIESTIVGFPEGELPKVFRPGGTPVEAIEAVVGPVQRFEGATQQPQTSGMLKSHYAPATPLQLGALPALLRMHAGKKVAVLSFREKVAGVPAARQVVLAPSGDPGEAARHLFAALRQLDALGLELILAERLPEAGLGLAINDRLQRAAAERG
jgi:L-threonylcarbamoyladenylate synthase